MPSPFPGMDPYLEGGLWSSFDHDLVVAARYQLIPKLRPAYYPFTEKYFLVESADLAIGEQRMNPDVGIVRKSPQRTTARRGTLSAPLLMETATPRPRRLALHRIAIRDREKRKLITAIEFLSPANKTGDARRQYLNKRAVILASAVHLIEIDLWRQGQRVPMREPFPPADYFVLVGRSQERPTTQVWPISLGETLPTIPVPLGRKDPEVSLDLQAAMSQVYDRGDFASLIDYRKPPEVALDPEESAWLERRLRETGSGKKPRTRDE